MRSEKRAAAREEGREQREREKRRGKRAEREERREKREERDKHDQDKWVKDAMVRSQNGGMVQKRVGP